MVTTRNLTDSTSFGAAFGAAVAASELRRLPRNNRIIALGDSRIAYGVTALGASGGKTITKGLMTWTRILARGSFDCDVEDIFATTGYTTAQVISNLLPSAVASSAGACVVLCGINDRLGGLSLAQSIANLTTIRDQLLASGKVVIFIAETPRGSSVDSGWFSGQNLGDHITLHQWFLAQSATPGVYVVDPWPYLADPADKTKAGVLAAYYGTDSLHPLQTGTYGYWTSGLSSLLTRLYTQRPILPGTNTDQFGATMLNGCLTPNPLTLTGTGGSAGVLTGSGLTGTVADNYQATLLNGAGLTVAASIVTDPNGLSWQQFVISGTPTAAGPEIRFANANPSAIPATSLNAGDVVDAFSAFQVDAGQTGLNAVLLFGVDAGASGGTANRTDGDVSTTTETYPSAAIDGILRLPKFTIFASNTLALSDRIRFIQNTAVSATVRFRCLTARKV